jgi:heat shock protein HslJ
MVMTNIRIRYGAIILLATILSADGALFAQAPAATNMPSDLSRIQDTDFRLVRFLNNGKEIVIPPTVAITLTLRKGGQISGRSAVNNYAGRFAEEPNGTIDIQLTTATQMAGPSDLMVLEREYFDALSHVKRIHLKSDQLIFENDTTSMTFTSTHSK